MLIWLPAIRRSHLTLVHRPFTVYLRPLKISRFLKKNCENHRKCGWNQFFIKIYNKIHIFTSGHIHVMITFFKSNSWYLIGVIECRNYTLGVFCARGEAEGCKTHRGFNFYSILRQQTHFECPKRSWGHLTCKSDTFLCWKMF